MNFRVTLLFSISVLFFASCETSKNTNQQRYQINLLPKNDTKASGQIVVETLQQNKIHISGKITGLSPNSVHGFHIHEKGDCSDSAAMNAGGHFNPDSHHQHGESIASTEYKHQHAGDLGNIKANANGIALIDVNIEKPINLIPDDKFSILGKSIIIHADEDDEKTAPAGNAGKRILCGVIK